jgi:hypothetical protein
MLYTFGEYEVLCPKVLPDPWCNCCVWLKIRTVCNQNHASAFFNRRKWLWFYFHWTSRTLKNITHEDCLYQTGVTIYHKRILFHGIFWRHRQRESNENTWPHYETNLWIYWKETVPKLILVAHQVTLYIVKKVPHDMEHGIIVIIIIIIIISSPGCPILEKNKRSTRQDRVGTHLHYSICKGLGIKKTEKWHTHTHTHTHTVCEH